MNKYFRNLLAITALATCFGNAAFGQQVIINGTNCTTGSVTFGSNAITVSATGPCVTTQAVIPTLTSLNPTAATPGTTITATGSNFAAGATVVVGSAAASGVTVQSSTQLTFIVPSVAAGTPNVVITVNGQSTGSLPLTVSAVTPTISGVSPASANPGTALAITGTNFASGATVTIGGTNAPVTAVTSTSITATVPALAVGSSPVIVTVGGTASNAFNVSITAATPVITSFTPTSTTAGQSITITGTGFAPGATVTIGGQAATVVGTPTSTTIVATVPALAPGNYSVIATVSGVGSTAGSALSVTTGTPVPTVSACSGTVGGTFNVTGTNFVAGSTSVTLGGTSAVTTAVTATSITANVPSGAVAGTSAVVVTVSGQSSSSFSCTLTPAVVGGTITTDSQGNTIPIPSKNPNTMGPIHPGLNGANAGGSVLQFQNAWDVAASGRCANATPAISRIWYHNLNYPSYQGTNQVEFFGIAANEALVYSFVAPADGTHASFQFNESPYATSVAQLASISDVPCDFDPNKIGVASSSPYFSCVRSFNGSGNTLSFYSSAGAPSGFAECKLTPGTRYYINYRSWNPGSSGVPATDACFTSTQSTTALCGGLLSFR